jgi:hypothetical protein
MSFKRNPDNVILCDKCGNSFLRWKNQSGGYHTTCLVCRQRVRARERASKIGKVCTCKVCKLTFELSQNALYKRTKENRGTELCPSCLMQGDRAGLPKFRGLMLASTITEPQPLCKDVPMRLTPWGGIIV